MGLSTESPEVGLLGWAGEPLRSRAAGGRRRGLEFLFPSLHLLYSPFSPPHPQPPPATPVLLRIGEAQWGPRGCPAQEGRREGPWTRGQAGPLRGGPAQAGPAPASHIWAGSAGPPGGAVGAAIRPGGGGGGRGERRGAVGGRHGAGRTSRAAAAAQGTATSCGPRSRWRDRGLAVRRTEVSSGARGRWASRKEKGAAVSHPVLSCLLRPHHKLPEPGRPCWGQI